MARPKDEEQVSRVQASGRLPQPRKLARTPAMQSQWNDRAAAEAVETYGAKGVSEDLALRVYTTRLLGRDPLLVLHGGGNTSVKTRARDDLGAGARGHRGQGLGLGHGRYRAARHAGGEARAVAAPCARSRA